MIYILIAFIGCILGYFIAKFTKEELKSGLFYFKFLEILILFILSLTTLYYSFEIFFFIFGIFFGIMIRNEYLYFGFSLFSANLNSSFIILSSLFIFLYGLPYGSIKFYRKKFFSLFYSLVLFFIPVLVYLLDYNMLSFSAGGLLSLFVIKSGRLFYNIKK